MPPASEKHALPEQTKLDDFAYKFPPTPRVGLVWPRPHRPALILLFAKKFFRVVATACVGVCVRRPDIAGRRYTRMRWTGQIFWLLASWSESTLPDCTFFPPSPPKTPGIGPWEVVSSYSSATAPDSHGISCADPLFSSSQRTGSRSSGLRLALQDLFNQRATNFLCPRLTLLPTSSSPVEPASSAPISRSRCRRNFRTRDSR